MKRNQNTNFFNENNGYVYPNDLSSLPESPGVYLMKNREGNVIYVGKAIRLKKRVSSYFNKTHHDVKTRALVEHIHIIDYIMVESEFEALILEANLIKKYNPRYNVMFKDNKFYPFIKVTLNEDFPRILFSRTASKDGARYFGPYTNARAVRRYIELVQRLFGLRTCRVMPEKVCLNFHIHRCTGPCVGEISQSEYRHRVEQAMRFLEGEFECLEQELESDMKVAAQDLEFEKARKYKENIEALRYFKNSQSVFLQSGLNADVISWASDMGKMLIVVSLIRKGRMVGKRSFSANPCFEATEDMLESFVLQTLSQSDLKQQVLIFDENSSVNFESLRIAIEKSFLLQTAIREAENDAERSLVKMARENAKLHLAQLLTKTERSEGLKKLGRIIGMKGIPMRIEGFDIANILGQQAVASLVSFWGGQPDKKNYRHFKIRSKDSPDDFAMIHEAVYRRYRRLRDEECDFPDLILIDGGKGQLHAAMDALEELGLELPLASLAKKNEEIFIPLRKEPIVLPKNSPSLQILQRVRDETHRFANSFYNKLKSADMLKSLFDDIPGIGEKRKKKIMEIIRKHDIIKDLKKEELLDTGISETSVDEVLKRLRTRRS